MKAKLFSCVVVLTLVSVVALPSFGHGQFVKTLGGSGSDEGYFVIQASDGGIFVTGNTNFGVYDDLLLTRFDASGNHLWTRTLGGSQTEYSRCLIETSDLGLAVTGQTQSFTSGWGDLLLAKFDASGDTIWTRTLGEVGQIYWGESVIEASDGAIVVAGGSGFVLYDLLLARFDALGNLIWVRTLGGFESEGGCSVIETYDGGIVVTGYTKSFGAGSQDLLLAKFGAAGDTLWTRTLGGSDKEGGYSVIETYDGGLVVTGVTASFGAGDSDLLLAKFNASGDIIWTRTLGGSDYDEGNSVIEASDGGLVVTGITASFGAGDRDLLLAKFDGSGNLLWTRVVGGSLPDGGESVIQTSDGDLIVTGSTVSFGTPGYNLLLAKFDGLGNTCMGEFVTPDITSPDPTITSPTPTITSPDPTITSPDPTITSPDPTPTTVCASPPVFIGHFMTPEGMPWPFDLIISDGEWVQEFDSVIYVETAVPETATYTRTYKWTLPGRNLCSKTLNTISIEPGEVRSFEHFAYHPDSLLELVRPYIACREVGANETLSWHWDSTNYTLTYTLSGQPGKIVVLYLILNKNEADWPNYALTKEAQGDSYEVRTTEEMYNDTLYHCEHTVRKLELDTVATAETLVIATVPPTDGLVGIYGVFRNSSLIETFNTKLYDIASGDIIAPEFVFPEYAEPPGHYLLHLLGLPIEYTGFDLPVFFLAGNAQSISIYPPKKNEIHAFTFSVIAEHPFGQSSYSNLFHALGDSITVDVSTHVTYRDWWGCFVLPTNLTVDRLFAYSDTLGEEELTELYDFTINHIEDSDLFLTVVRNEPYYNGLTLKYAPRGDVNGDGVVDLGDVLSIINYLYKGGSAPHPLDRADVNCDGVIDLGDLLYLISYLYKGGPPPCQG